MAEEPNAASVALVHRGRVLLIKRARAPYQHLWTLPGGRREAGETAADCAVREVREEVGLTAHALRPVATERFASGGTSWVLAVFATEAFEGEVVASEEIADHRWFTLEQVATVRTTSRLANVLEGVFRLFDRR